jgi:hypothetical protein
VKFEFFGDFAFASALSEYPCRPEDKFAYALPHLSWLLTPPPVQTRPRRLGVSTVRAPIEGVCVRRRKLVELGPPVVFRSSPLGGKKSAKVKAMEGRVEGALINLKQVVRTSVSPTDDGIGVKRAQFKRLQISMSRVPGIRLPEPGSLRSFRPINY